MIDTISTVFCYVVLAVLAMSVVARVGRKRKSRVSLVIEKSPTQFYSHSCDRGEGAVSFVRSKFLDRGM